MGMATNVNSGSNVDSPDDVVSAPSVVVVRTKSVVGTGVGSSCSVVDEGSERTGRSDSDDTLTVVGSPTVGWVVEPVAGDAEPGPILATSFVSEVPHPDRARFAETRTPQMTRRESRFVGRDLVNMVM